jgi:ribosomal RNA-processing protein 7
LDKANSLFFHENRKQTKRYDSCTQRHTFEKAEMAPIAKSNSSNIPTSVNEYTILPLSIPATPAFPQPTTHYLYLRPNAPKIPTDNTSREVFVVNLPIDATEPHLRALFAKHGGGARVSHVEFEGQRTGRKVTAPVTSSGTGGLGGSSRKRKRGGLEREKEVKGLLPEVWDRSVGRSGNTCVVLFVDAAAAELCLREVKKGVKGGREFVWGTSTAATESVEDKVPALGAASKFLLSPVIFFFFIYHG